jgi:hypothetical protein
MPDEYIRPPIVALERPSYRLAQWRIRVIILLFLLGVALGAFLIARAIVDSGTNGSAQGAPHRAVAGVRADLP